jgi:hypothetical protein
MSKANDKLTEGFIYAEMFNKVIEIPRTRLSEMHRNQKSAEGRDITKGGGGNTTNVMKQFALKEPSYTFVDSGRDKRGFHINPRLVKTISQ